MNNVMKLGMSVAASIALFALSGCSLASASAVTPDESRSVAVEVATADRQPNAAADADNGPGCAESALDSLR